MRATFERLVNHPEERLRPVPAFPKRVDGRARHVVPRSQTVLDAFGADRELPAGEIVNRLRGIAGLRVETVHTVLSKLAARGLLVRVRWGVYARP